MCLDGFISLCVHVCILPLSWWAIIVCYWKFHMMRCYKTVYIFLCLLKSITVNISHTFKVKYNRFHVFGIILAELVHKNLYRIIHLLSLACPEVTERKRVPYNLPVIYISDNGQEVQYIFHKQPFWFRILIPVNHNFIDFIIVLTYVYLTCIVLKLMFYCFQCYIWLLSLSWSWNL
jgi:hypothetical protein